MTAASPARRIPSELLDALTSFESPVVFNPWSEQDSLDLHWGSGADAEMRMERLQQHFDCDPLFILIGEAPGYQGCHFSGVPFTNEKLIMQGKVPRVSIEYGRITTRELPWCEPSATIVWRVLHELGIADRVVMWNAFAWHPHRQGEPYSNRAPSRAELDAGLPVLRAVLDHFTGVPVVPVGRVAEVTLSALGIKTRPGIRHPANGGAGKFRSGLREIVEALR